MRIATMVAPKKIKFTERDIPQCAAHEVRIRVLQIGICGSDIHVWHGQHPFTDYPIIQGHEFVGFIDAIGEAVNSQKFSLGRLATAMPQIICGKCNPCKQERYNICENLKVRGFQADGCGQDFFVADAEHVFVLPDDFSLNQGAFMEPTAVAAHVIKRLDLVKEKNIIVTGAGTIGNLIAQVMQLYGANILLLDIEEQRLKIAQQCGIKNVGNVKDQSLAYWVRKYFGRKGFSIAIEASGAEAALQSMIPAIEKGGTLLLVGVYAHPVTLDMARASEHELTIKGSMMYWKEDWERALKYLKKDINIEPLITHNFLFEEWEKAYEYIDNHRKEAIKVMLSLT